MCASRHGSKEDICFILYCLVVGVRNVPGVWLAYKEQGELILKAFSSLVFHIDSYILQYMNVYICCSVYRCFTLCRVLSPSVTRS